MASGGGLLTEIVVQDLAEMSQGVNITMDIHRGGEWNIVGIEINQGTHITNQDQLRIAGSGNRKGTGQGQSPGIADQDLNHKKKRETEVEV